MASNSDPYADWRASIRTTLKWYAAALVATGTTLIGGLNFGVLADLEEGLRRTGLGLFLFALILVAAGIFTVYRVLTSEPFSRKQLTENNKVRTRLEPYLKNLIGTAARSYMPHPIDEGATGRLKALDDLIEAYDKGVGDPAVSVEKITLFDKTLSQITSFAAGQSLEAEARTATHAVSGIAFLLAILAVVLTLIKLDGVASEDDSLQVVFSPGPTGWNDYAEALAAACGDTAEGLPAKGKQDTPFDGWWTITLDGPACKGVTLAVPGAVVQASSSASQ